MHCNPSGGLRGGRTARQQQARGNNKAEKLDYWIHGFPSVVRIGGMRKRLPAKIRKRMPRPCAWKRRYTPAHCCACAVPC
jgi:hypothetical protein